MSPTGGPYGREAHADRTRKRNAAGMAEVGLHAVQWARCGAGDHDETTVPSNRVVYGANGARLAPGTRYCRCCWRVFA